jgi:putative tryptophan/tyrosine transport system ATP-binding protein
MMALRNIEVVFGKGTPLETHALRDINLEVPAGQFLTVIGSNGAGKSTALNVIAGSIVASHGEVLIDDVDVTRWPVHARSRLISRVFQDPKAGTCEQMTILENFAVACERTAPRGLHPAIDRSLRQKVWARLERLKLGLEDRLDDRVGLLSGGQRQAISLLMATMGTTRVLLLDEHTAALDPATGEFVLMLTDDIVRDLSISVMMVTHSMAQALHHGDRTVMFHRGQIVFDVSGDERRRMTVNDLIALFKRDRGEELSDDALLLT